MKTLSIIHLSDLHLQHPNEFEERSLLGTLVNDIKQTVAEQELVPSFIVISGDLTYHGWNEEFDIAKAFIRIIREKIQPVGIILCPGNHDMDWKEQQSIITNKELMENLFRLPAESAVQRIEDRFEREGDRPHLKAGMSNYYNFLKDKEINQPFDGDYLYSLVSLDIEKFKVNFISLNSAYLFSNDYKYFGYIGRHQIERAYADAQRDIQPGTTLFNVCVVHHPFEAITPAIQQEIENVLRSRFNIILNGHVHNMKVTIDVTANLDGENKVRPIVSCSRCVIDKVENPAVTPGYSIIRINFDSDRVGPLAIYQKKYNYDRRAWVRDAELDFPIIVDITKDPKSGLGDSIASLESTVPLAEIGLIGAFPQRAETRDYVNLINNVHHYLWVSGVGLGGFQGDHSNSILLKKAKEGVDIRFLIADPETKVKISDLEYSLPAWSDFVVGSGTYNQSSGQTFLKKIDTMNRILERTSSKRKKYIRVRYYSTFLAAIFRADSIIYYGPYLTKRLGLKTFTIKLREGRIFDQVVNSFEAIWEDKNYSRKIESVFRGD